MSNEVLFMILFLLASVGVVVLLAFLTPYKGANRTLLTLPSPPNSTFPPPDLRRSDGRITEITLPSPDDSPFPPPKPPKPTLHREELAEGSDHLTVTGTFQSDKFAWCPAGFVPLKLTDPAARDLLEEYAMRRREIDPEFGWDLHQALLNVPPKANGGYGNFDTIQKLRGRAYP